MAAKRPKITIKPFRHQAQMDPNYAQNTWRLLQNAIHEIHKQNASGLSFEELYRNAYNMVLHKYGDMLYRGLKSVVEEHLASVARDISAANDEDFLPALVKAWNDHKTSMIMIRDILMYMDRVYVPQQNLEVVYDLGLTLFRDSISRSSAIKGRLLSRVLQMIQNERSGEVIQRGLLKDITSMHVELGHSSKGVYTQDFEKPFLDRSSEFYHAEALEFISSNSCPDYMKKAEERLKEETNRVKLYLHVSTEPKIRQVVVEEMLTAHLKTLVEMENSGAVPLIRDNKMDDLKRMYSLLTRVNKGLEYLKQVLSSYLLEVGKALVTDEEKQKDVNAFVQALLDLKDKYDDIVDQAFGKDKHFMRAIQQTFESFLNMNPKSPEYLSLFIDHKLKLGLKDAGEDEVEVVLDKVMMIFRFLQEKDVFEKYYKQHLAKRLLLGRSLSDDIERVMIAKLKTECGYQFTSKLEGMFTDMKTSADTMEQFRSYLQNQETKPLGGVDLNVHVLTTGFWPTQSSAKCSLPPQIVQCCEVFRKYYLSKYSGRRLAWQTNMGTAELKALFGTKRHELNVSTYQMCILLLFNNSDQLTCKEIRDQTDISPVELKRSLLSLSMGKYKILNKENKTSKVVGDNEVFSFNDKFQSRLYRIKILMVAGPETEKEAAGTREKIDEDRKHQIEAAIVRVMKSNKTLDHNNLIAEVTKQLSARFVPSPVIIKKRIESLIEREYLERSRTDRKLYNYLA